MSRESILERNRKRAQENDQKMGATALGTSALNYSTQRSLERAAAEKVARESTGRLIDVSQPWLDTITPVTPSSRSASRWSGTTPSSRGGGFGETESQGEGYFTQSRQSPLERAARAVSSAASSYLGGFANVGGEAAAAQRNLWRESTQESVSEWQREIDNWQRNLDEWRADGTLTDQEEQFLNQLIRGNQERIAQYTTAQRGREETVGAARDLADQWAARGEKERQAASAGLNGLGRFAVDAGIGLAQYAGDVGIGALTGGSAMVPMAIRGFGGGAQQARLEGADDGQAALFGLASAALESVTEGLGSAGRINSRFFGEGALDEIMEGMVAALERKGSTAAGRAALNRIGTAATAFVSEGAEEALSSLVSPLLERAIYSDEPLDVGEILGDALYDFAVGGTIGAIAGGAGGTDTTRAQAQARTRLADQAITDAYSEMSRSGMFSPASTQARAEASSYLDNVSSPALQAVEMLAQGQEISGSQATRIARDPEALSLLQELTGQEINTDAPISQVRSNIQAVAAARRGTSPVQTQTQENTQAQQGAVPAASQEARTAAQQVYDVNRMQRAASALGESGRRALNAAYDGSADAERFYGGFAAYYEAGVSGRNRESVRSEYAGELNEAQRFAAYAAGQNDAAASLAREQAAAQYAPVAGEDSGLVYDDFVRQAVESGQSAEGQDAPYLTQETAERINSVAKALGLRVRFVDSVREGTANASIQGSEVLVERNNPNPVMFLLGHEWTHRLQETAPTEYRAFREFVADEVQGEARVLLDTYRAQGEDITYEQALDEAAANYAGRMIEDGQVLDNFIQRHRQDRTLLERIRDAIRALVRKLTGAEKKAAQTAEGKLSAALEAAERQVERNAQERGGDRAERFSLKPTDSQGRELTPEQMEFFRDSKVRIDEWGDYGTDDGPLVPVYHATWNDEFTVFDRQRLGENTDGNANDEALAATAHVGFWFNSQDLSVRNGRRPRAGSRAEEVYLNITNPYYAGTLDGLANDILDYSDSETPATLGEEFRDYLQSNGYDGIILNDREFGGVSFVAFDPEQIKRTTNRTPTSDPDIRFSRKGSENAADIAALQEENTRLRERVNYWRGQTRRTTPGEVDQKAVNRAARELIRDFDSTISAADISGDLLSLYNYMGTGREGNDELTYTEARRRADNIARRVVESAQITEDGVYQEYRELRDYLRSTPLSISQEDASDIADYNDFRRRNFGRLNLRSGDTNIDQVYQELSEMWPEFFDEVRENNPVDQLLHISEVAEQLYRISAGNPFAGNLREAQAGVSNEILERFFDIPQVRATFADRAAQAVENERQRGRERVNRVREQRDARITQLRQQNRERVQRAIQRERDTRERQLERMKNRYQARNAAGRERRTARELRARISRHVKDLSRKLLRPNDKQHIPEQLRTAVAAMLEAINLESVYTVDRSTGRRQKGGEGDPTKRTEAFRQLRQAYAEITKDGADYTLVIDPDLMDNLDELAAMRNIPLAEMSIPQLTTVWDTVKAVEASVRTANKMLGQSRFQTISQVANGLKDDNILRQDRGDFKGILGRMDKLVNMDMLTPQIYFHRLGRTGDEMFRMLRAAQDRQIQIMYDAERATRDIIGKTDINKLERETHTFQVEGGTVTLSTAQIMSLYELMKREQAQEHIFTGGIRPETIPGQRGIRESRRSAPVRVTAENLAEMVGTLTDEQVEMADKLQQYMGGRLSELGNEASMEVYGYRKFTEPHYFPIQVDRNQTQRDISKEVQAQTIAGRGFTKGTVPRANNAVMLNSIFDVYSAHVNDMATYAAWLSTMENVRRIRDFTFRDGEGNRTGTVKDIIERVFGRNGNPYLNKLVDDLNQGVRSTADPGLMDRIVGNYKAASVSANLRVILQQPTAILRALNTLDAKYLLAGTVKRGDWQKVKQYAPIAQWKDWGYFDINTGRQMKDVLFDSDTRLERLRQAGMAGASAADSFTWARLWNAVEAETKDRRKDLKPGTKEFYQAVGQRFSEIVDQTQVVDGVLQRSHIMRSPDGLTKMTTSFMGEPTKSYNMFLNAVYDLRHATGKESRRTARRALVRTSVALAVSFTINAVMQSLVDGLRDDDKELDYWERVQRAFIGFSGDEESFLDYWNSFWSGNLEASYNPLSYMPYFKDLVSIIQGYDVSRMDAEALEKVFTSGKNFWQALNGEGRYSLAGASASFLAELSRLFGLPVANLKRDIQGTVTSAAIETDDYWLQYQIDKALLNIGYSGNRSGFMDILYAASVNDPEAYELIYDDMTASGITQEQIRTSMETRMREAQGVESVADLTRRYLTPDQERTYNRIYSQVTSSAIWSAASEEQREAVEDDLYDLAAGTDDGQRLQEKINGGASYGISDGDYLLYLAAREIADAANEDPEKRNGSIDQSEAEAAIDMLTGLSNEAKAYLWQSTNKGWSEKNNPYR